MKHIRTFFTLLMTVMLLLVSVSVWAMPPEDGIYEKKDGNGNVTARMFVITLSGKAVKAPNEMTLETSGGGSHHRAAGAGQRGKCHRRTGHLLQLEDGYSRRGGNRYTFAG